MRARRFIAIDGEGATNPDTNEHTYTLIASSLGNFQWKDDGLSTAECFNFLLSQRALAKRYVFVAFGLNYDVNMWLRDVGRKKLETLWREHQVTWYGFKMEWIPGKWFSVSKPSAGLKPIRIYDVFGFFQKSFVNSLKAWGIPVQDEMVEMKAARSNFDAAMKQRIIDYCISECESLVELMDKLKDALQEVDLCPKSWVGAGSIAAGLLNKHDVRDFHAYDHEFPKPVGQAILHAYFGGRVELFKQGRFPLLIDYDVRSAYPSQALALPSLCGGKWSQVGEYVSGHLYGLYRVSWTLPETTTVAPFPMRHKRNIYYPTDGSGWYHAAEIRRALEIYGKAITIEDGWIYEPSEPDKPFDFVRAEFAHRARLKASGHPSEKVLKLGLNALYGKLAQGHGFRGNEPPYQSYYWAGFLTAGTRAKLLDAASVAPKSLVMIATDGIFFEAPGPDLVTSEVLGGWEKSEIKDCFVAQPGVYAGMADGEYIARSRGFFAKEIDFDALRDGYEKQGPYFVASYSSTRFLGLGAALTRSDFSDWRRWHTGERELRLYPSRKFVREDLSPAPTPHYPPSLAGEFSERYVPKDGELKWAEDLTDFIAGMEQPLKDY